MVSPSATRDCLPPVEMTAYIGVETLPAATGAVPAQRTAARRTAQWTTTDPRITARGQNGDK